MLTVLLFAMLGQAAGRGDIQVTCPPGLRVYLDEQFVGVSSTNEDGKYIVAVASGLHTVRVEKQGFVPVSRQVRVTDRGTVEVRISELTPTVVAIPNDNSSIGALRMKVGALVVSCAPVRCTYEFMGQTFQNGEGVTSQTLSNVPAGSHAIVFRRGPSILRGQVSIAADGIEEIKADFLNGRILNLTAEREAEKRRLAREAEAASRPVRLELVVGGSAPHGRKREGDNEVVNRTLRLEIYRGSRDAPTRTATAAFVTLPKLALTVCTGPDSCPSETREVEPGPFFVRVQCDAYSTKYSRRSSTVSIPFRLNLFSQGIDGQPGSSYRITARYDSDSDSGCTYNVERTR